MTVLLMLLLLVAAVLANLVGRGAGLASYWGGTRESTWVLTIGLFSVAVIVAGYSIKKRWDGAFIDSDNRISLSRFQIVLWTVLLMGSLFTAALTNVAAPGDPGQALDIKIPPQVWALLGLGALTAVAAPAIKDGRRTAGGQGGAELFDDEKKQIVETITKDQKLISKPTFKGQVLVKKEPRDARWLDLIQGDYEGSIYLDTSKLQQISFTVLLVTAYGSAVWAKMAAAGRIDELPSVAEGFVALLTISHVAYLADKQFART